MPAPSTLLHQRYLGLTLFEQFTVLNVQRFPVIGKNNVCATKVIRGECQSLINHFEDNPEDVTLMVGQKDSSKAVSTEALMTVFHPQDVENLDPKMVNIQI